MFPIRFDPSSAIEGVFRRKAKQYFSSEAPQRHWRHIDSVLRKGVRYTAGRYIHDNVIPNQAVAYLIGDILSGGFNAKSNRYARSVRRSNRILQLTGTLNRIRQMPKLVRYKLAKKARKGFRWRSRRRTRRRTRRYRLTARIPRHGAYPNAASRYGTPLNTRIFHPRVRARLTRYGRIPYGAYR